MQTEAGAHAEVMHAVFTDRGRSVERAVELGIKAGIKFERDRMRSILQLKVPSARGIERTVMVMALSGSSLEQVTSFVDFMSNNIDPEALARSRRAEFEIIGNLKEDVANAG